MWRGEPVRLLQQEQTRVAHSLGLDVRRVTREVGKEAWHRRWRAVTHPGIPSSGALSAGKWKPQLLLHEWETVETKEWRSLEVGGNRKGVFCLLGQLLSLSRGSLQRSSWNRQCEQEARGADSLFLYFNGLFNCFEKGERKQRVSSRSGSLPLTACFSDIFPLLLPFSGMSVCSGCTRAHTHIPDRPSGQSVAVSALFAHCYAVDVRVLCHAGQLHPVLGAPRAPVLHEPRICWLLVGVSVQSATSLTFSWCVLLFRHCSAWVAACMVWSGS